MLLIFVHRRTERLDFTTGLIFSRILGVGYEITESRSAFQEWSGPKLFYGQTPPSEGLFLDAHSLLWDEGVTRQQLNLGKRDGLPVLFRGSHPRSVIGFDLFAAVFYMVSRYEEYLPFNADAHGRFPSSESLAVRENFLRLPVVNIWCRWFGEALKKHYPDLNFMHSSYRYIPTIDIDHAWCFLGRPWWRTLGGMGRSLMKFDFRNTGRRMATLLNLQPDPYDTYSFIEEVHNGNPSLPLFFILMADSGGNDNNVTVTSVKFSRLVRSLDKDRRVGVHPSLSSNRSGHKLRKEVDLLEKMIGRDVTHSRQHFLSIRFPETFRLLISSGIRHDFSLGFPDQPGFRAGIASPFPFFDLKENRTTDLILHPVTFMDVTYRDHLRLTPAEALKSMEELINRVRECNGELVTIWHNESLGEDPRWHGWQDVYPSMLQMASPES